MKRLVIFLFAMVFVIGQAAVWAQIDQLPPEAGQTADKLIELLDAGQYQETYTMASSVVTYTPALWNSHMRSRRASLGEVESRVVNKVESVARFADLPEGDYTKITYLTDFANQTEASEIVVLNRSKDSLWDIADYEVHYNLWPEALKMIGLGLFVVFFIMVLLATITWTVGRVLQKTTKKTETNEQG
jgi:ABC-type multidrug transport system fused ATPase/permease subunit